jgi:hypothetical protein
LQLPKKAALKRARAMSLSEGMQRDVKAIVYQYREKPL